MNFELNEIATQTIEKWYKDNPENGCIGGLISYIVTPTSLGIIVVLQNNVTKELVDTTKYNEW